MSACLLANKYVLQDESMLRHLSLASPIEHQQLYSCMYMIACVIRPVPSPMPGMAIPPVQAQHRALVLCSSTSKKRHDAANLFLKPLVRLLTLPLLL